MRLNMDIKISSLQPFRQAQQAQIYACASHWSSSRVRASSVLTIHSFTLSVILLTATSFTANLIQIIIIQWCDINLCDSFSNLDWKHNDFLYVYIGMWYFIFITSNKIRILIPNLLFLPPFPQSSSRFLWWIRTISLAFLICGCSIPSRCVLYTKSTWCLTY